MTTTTTPSQKITRIIGSAFALIPSALVLSSALSIVTPPASAFEVERGHRGASRIVTQDDAKTATPRRQKAQAKRRTTIFVKQGSHGAHRIVTQEGIGGASGKSHLGSPVLDGTVHETEGWFPKN